MNDQTLLPPQSDLTGDGADAAPFPTIEPAMVELVAAIDDPVVDEPLHVTAVDQETIDFIPVAIVRAMASAELAAASAMPATDSATVGEQAAHAGRPIASVMDRTLWTVHAEDSIEKVEEILAEQKLASAPVVGSNGAIVGMIGPQELAQFHTEGKNPKAVQAWEISRIRTFEVSPGDSVEDVARLMADNKIENISVTESGRLIGIVSAQDLLLDMLKGGPDTGGK